VRVHNRWAKNSKKRANVKLFLIRLKKSLTTKGDDEKKTIQIAKNYSNLLIELDLR